MPLKVFYLILTLTVLTIEVPDLIVANNTYLSAFDILSNNFTNNVTLDKIKKYLQYNSHQLISNNSKYDDKVCVDQLNALVDGLTKNKLWAISSKCHFVKDQKYI